MKKPIKVKAIGIIVTSLISIITAVLGSYLFYELTKKSGQLNYEVFPIASFESQNNQV
jgi:hypothetical protein